MSACSDCQHAGQAGAADRRAGAVRRMNNDWYDAAYPAPAVVDARVYDP